MKLLVLCGGPSAEHEVSLKTARMILQSLNETKYETERAVIEKNGTWTIDNKKSLPATDAVQWVVRSRFDFVFIAIHGAFGEDGRLQTILEWLDIPYSGSGILSSGMAMDKHVANILYRAHGLRVPEYAVIKNENEIIKLPLPLVIKPIGGGSSVGVSIVKDKKNLKSALRNALKTGNHAMIQRYIKGRELTCGVLEDKNGKPFALPPTEIVPKNAQFFDYHAKYAVGGSEEITPARLSKKQTQDLQKLAVKAHTVLGCSGMSRSDFILSNGRFFILETNTIPGMTETSLLPQAALAAGIDFPTLLDMIIQNGLRNAKHH